MGPPGAAGGRAMVDVVLYAAAVLLMGTSWLGIKLQFGVVAPEISLVYRFAVASLLLFAFCLASGRRLRFGPREHAFMALQGVLLFSVNQALVYLGLEALTSGLAAIAFSTIVVMNIVNGAVLFRTSIQPRVVVGAALGLAGIACLFWPEVRSFDPALGGARGLVLVLAGTYLASLGNLTAIRNQMRGLPVVECITFAMGYGAAFMAVVSLIRGLAFDFEPSMRYVASLAYVSVASTAIGFWCYLTLLGRIGAARGSYSAVLIPVVALAISTVAEGYRWTALAALGLGLILAGNVLMLTGVGKGGTGAPARRERSR